MARKLTSDRILFTAAVLLVFVSVVMVYSASAALALDRYGQAYMFLTRQAMWTLLGLVALAVAMRIDYRTYRNEPFIWSLTAVVCVLLVLVLFSAPVNGTPSRGVGMRTATAAPGSTGDWKRTRTCT